MAYPIPHKTTALTSFACFLLQHTVLEEDQIRLALQELQSHQIHLFYIVHKRT